MNFKLEFQCSIILKINKRFRGALHVDELKFRRGWNFLGYMDSSTRVENKKISTRAEIKNTICSMFVRHGT